jgi:fatty-acyl-CoA synthase
MEKITANENYTVRILQRLSAKGDADAIVAAERHISGSEAVALILRFAAALRGSGLAAEDGVALFAQNSPEAVLLQLAIHFIGCRLVFVPPDPGNGELEGLIQRARAETLLFDPALEERAWRIAERTRVRQVFAIGPSSIAPDFLTLASGVAGLSLDEAGQGQHLAMLFYTGGTTGQPKLVVHRGRYYAALLNNSGIYFSSAPAEGATLLCTLVTPMLYDLLDHPGCRPGRFPALTALVYSGAAPSPARLTAAIERFGPVLRQLYGSTELGTVTQLTPAEHDPQRPESLSSCGRGVRGGGRPAAGRPDGPTFRAGASVRRDARS